MKRRGSGGHWAPLAVLAFLAMGVAHGAEEAGAEPATLVIWNRPIVSFRATVAGVPPGQRARNAEARIAALPAGAGATRIAVQPGRIGETSFMDATPHRRALPAAYQLYRRVSRDPAHDTGQEDEQALLSPLYITSFLIEDFLADNQLFGGRSVIIASASSKTALGVAQRLSLNRPQSCEVIGLTSARNRAFCEQLGHYDRVIGYDALESLPAQVAHEPTADEAAATGHHHELVLHGALPEASKGTSFSRLVQRKGTFSKAPVWGHLCAG